MNIVPFYVKLSWFYVFVCLFWILTFSFQLSIFFLNHILFSFLYLSFCGFDLLQILLFPSFWEMFPLPPAVLQMDGLGSIYSDIYFSLSLWSSFVLFPHHINFFMYFHYFLLCVTLLFLINQWKLITFLSCSACSSLLIVSVYLWLLHCPYYCKSTLLYPAHTGCSVSVCLSFQILEIDSIY